VGHRAVGVVCGRAEEQVDAGAEPGVVYHRLVELIPQRGVVLRRIPRIQGSAEGRQ